MATKKKRSLGRGFEALLGNTDITALVDDKQVEQASDSMLRHMPIENLQPGRYQPRRDMREEL